MLRRVKEARLPRLKTLQEFDFAHSPVSAARVADLAAGGYIARAEPVLLIGEAGTGKTPLASGLCVAGCEQRRRVRFTTATALVNELVEARAANTLSRALGRWERIELIGIDELGYVPLAEIGAELLFQVIADRAERAARGHHHHQPAILRMGAGLSEPASLSGAGRPAHRPGAHHRDRHRVVPLPPDTRRQSKPDMNDATLGGVSSTRPTGFVPDTPPSARPDPRRKVGQHSSAKWAKVR